MPADTPTTETQFARARQIKAAHPLDIIAMTSDTAGRMSKLTVPELRLWLDAATYRPSARARKGHHEALVLRFEPAHRPQDSPRSVARRD
jgi:hypothetical protein